eukprot:6193-Heterococcus_DN1.PRE.1
MLASYASALLRQQLRRARRADGQWQGKLLQQLVPRIVTAHRNAKDCVVKTICETESSSV